jgi:general secretion pathway protein L
LSTLYIRLPSKAAADNVPHWITLPCAFALTAQGDAIEREGVAPLSELAGTIGKVQRVLLLLAASDVTLLRIQVPPLPAAKLKAALPNLVEDQLMSDPEECLIVPGAAVDGLRTVAVVNRGWFDVLNKTMQGYGARRVVAVPGQLCLPYQAGTVSAAVSVQDNEIDLTIRLNEQQGIGLPIVPEHAEDAVQDVLQALNAMVPEAPINLYVPPETVNEFQEATSTLLEQRITVHADSWPRMIAAAHAATPDLMTGVTGGARQMNWRRWRWPIIFAIAVVAVNLAGLNIEWWRMKREADALRASMIQTYRNAFPQETLIVDPLEQMRRKLAEAQRASGQLAPGDFLVLAAEFAEAWDSVAGEGQAMPGLAGVEYRDRVLLVRPKSDGTLPEERLRTALAARNLTLSQQGAGIWEIRSSK